MKYIINCTSEWREDKKIVEKYPIIKKYGYETITAGIGLGCDEELVVKAGKSGSGINDKIWIGKALVDAAHLADTANRQYIEPIAMSNLFYSNVIDLLVEDNPKYNEWIKCSNTYTFYHCNIISTEFNDWIKNNI